MEKKRPKKGRKDLPRSNDPTKLPLKRVPASQVSPAKLPPGHPDRTVSGRLGYFIKEFEEFRGQVEGLEEELQVSKHLTGEKNSLNQDCLDIEKKYDEARNILHKHDLKCPEHATGDCDQCTRTEDTKEPADEKDSVVDELDEPPPPCPRCGTQSRLVSNVGHPKFRCNACKWTWTSTEEEGHEEGSQAA